MWNFQMGTLVERFDEHDGLYSSSTRTRTPITDLDHFF